MTVNINKILGYSIARFGAAGIAFEGQAEVDVKEVEYWSQRTAEHFSMNADHEDIEIIHHDYKNYTATQMRDFIKTIK